MNEATIEVAQYLVIGYFGLVAALQLILMISAGRELGAVVRARGLAGGRPVLRSSVSPTVSVLVPAFNEEAMIVESVESILALEYPQLEVVVINDGSADRTFAFLERRFTLYEAPAIDAGALELSTPHRLHRSSTHPQLVVVDKVRGGKAEALNVGLVHASGRLVCAVDADTVVEPDAIERLIEPFIRDPGLLAAGGSVRPSNGCRFEHGRVAERRLPESLLAALQSIEYTRAFLFGRLGWNRLGGNIIISGAFGLFDRQAVIDSGGYLISSVGEDMELVLRLRRRAIEQGRSSAVAFLPEPMAWTEVPESVRALGRQRNRWHRGLLDTLWRHRRVIGRRRYGLMGTVVLPYYVLEALSPVMELVALATIVAGLALGISDWAIISCFLLIAYGFSMTLSAVAVGFEDSLDDRHALVGGRVRRFGQLAIEQFGYRQLTTLWRLVGVVGWLRGDRRWGTQVRRGAAAVDEPLAPTP